MAWNIETSRQVDADLEILVHQVNVDVAASIVIDASTVEPDPVTGERKLVAGTPMTKNANNQYQEWDSATADQNTQLLVIDAAGGDYTLTHSGNTTAALDFDATAADVETALEDTADLTDVEVSGTGDADDPFVITIVDGEVSAITADDTNLTGGASTATVSTAGTPVIAGILARTERFPDGTRKSDLPSAIWNHGQWFRADRIKGWATNSAAIRAALPTCKFS
jgi:hypothetical protein